MVVFLRSSFQSLSTRSLSPLLMSLHRQEMGFRPVLHTYVSSVTSSKAWKFRTTSSLPFVLWPRRLSRALILSLRQRNRLHDRSRTCLRNCFRRACQSSSHTSNPHTMSLSPPGSSGRLPACVTRTSTSAPAELLEAPPVFADSCGVSNPS